MSFSERIDAAKQTYRNYLDAHPDSRAKKLKALTKTVTSFCNRKVMEWSLAQKKLPGSNAGKSPSSPIHQTLPKRRLSVPDNSQTNYVNEREVEQEAEAQSPHPHESTEKETDSQSAMTDSTEDFPDSLITEKLDHTNAKAKLNVTKFRRRRPPTRPHTSQ